MVGDASPWELRTLPLYPYRCTQCGHKFEKIQSFSAKPEEVCPKCGGALERPLTVPGFHFKGAGWYVNDYASKSSSSSDSSTSDAKTGDSGGKPAPAETKSPAETGTASGCGGACACAAASSSSS
jgi:putative FmdB family regulatory protein